MVCKLITACFTNTLLERSKVKANATNCHKNVVVVVVVHLWTSLKDFLYMSHMQMCIH